MGKPRSHAPLCVSLHVLSSLVTRPYGSHLSSHRICSSACMASCLVSSVLICGAHAASSRIMLPVHVFLPYAQLCYSSRMRTNACYSSSGAASGDPIDERRERMRLCSSFRMPPPPLLHLAGDVGSAGSRALLLAGDVGSAGSRALSRALLVAPTGLRIADWISSAVGLFVPVARWDL